ncbi:MULTISPECIES: hypothetical protein [unclassified Eubacterium (in: firmicutes)]|jgi:hypothetical protein|uniref:hypothetical protein n=1 Tax=unclassified Eubacterium (in: firmicutes) TaxID=2624479 RepID=UPI000E54598F|nr:MULTISPECIES: hypothetical protein [unclassified Eubacterium (in: firmicutes)]RHR33929.1 hypothetical protein DWX29_08545 [Eubacterium sp. AF19-12LB]
MLNMIKQINILLLLKKLSLFDTAVIVFELSDTKYHIEVKADVDEINVILATYYGNIDKRFS